jgi:spermidine synthase
LRYNGIPVSWLILIALLYIWVARRSARQGERFSWLYYLFFFSGFPALIYQIVWERALFTIYGVNIESVTVVVTGFLLGLGLGSLLGGRISRISRIPLLACFGAAELGTAAFGIFSLSLFHHAALYTAGGSVLATGIISFTLVLIPTILMGSTLPLLVAHMVRSPGNVGQSVGMLYFVNTLGSAAACFIAAAFTMRVLGQSGSIALAAALNTVVGSLVLMLYLSQRTQPSPEASAAALSEPDPVQDDEDVPLQLPIAAGLVALTGFIALAYEIIWYRLFSFYSGSKAMVFACLLGAYLFGVAIGGLVAHDLARRIKRDRDEYLRLISCFVVVANLIGYSVAWAMSLAAVNAAQLLLWMLSLAQLAGFTVPPTALTAEFYGSALLILPIVAIAAAFLAATFPLICHLSLPRDARAGSGLGVLYFSNIVGAALGSFLVGFVLMNIWGVRQLSVFLALLGVGLGFVLLLASRPNKKQLVTGVAGIAAVSTGIVALANPLFDGLYEKMLFKRQYQASDHFVHLVENRSGVIGVTKDDTVYGGGMYDGRFNVGLRHDVNSIYRLYALSSFHPAPRAVLMIGLASGSWAQIIANHPQVENLTIVEINPGYLQLIPKYPQVASVLKNPKVKIVTDDGRRWLVSNPDCKFDVIVMNTTFNWREHMSNLLSTDFLELARHHLLPRGVIYYNTTRSGEVLLTGATVFPYALRVANFLVVSDSTIELDSDRLAKTLLEYRIDGHPVLDPTVSGDSQRFQGMLSLTHRFSSDDSLDHPSLEYGDSIRKRLRGKRIITDDNMGTEWTK